MAHAGRIGVCAGDKTDSSVDFASAHRVYLDWAWTVTLVVYAAAAAVAVAVVVVIRP
jgi:hypothetical protein